MIDHTGASRIARGAPDLRCIAAEVRGRSSDSSRTNHQCLAQPIFHYTPDLDPTPSPDDQHLTQRLVDAGRMLGIPVVDHVIVGEGRWFSFRDAGLLRP